MPDQSAPKSDPSDFRRTFSANVRLARQQAGLSQQELGERAGLNPKYMYKIELVAPNATLDTVTALARVLGMTELDLLTPQRLFGKAAILPDPKSSSKTRS